MQKRLARAGWILTATIVLLYAPMAAEYMLRFFGGGPDLWEHTYSGVVGDRQALGPGSDHLVQHDVYARYRWVMLTHTVVGALAIVLSVFQLTRRSRVRLSVHRWIGRLQVGMVAVSMIGAMAFLTLAGPQRTFDGPAFHLQLWALAIGTLGGTTLGLWAIRAGHQATHRILMTYAFALLCTAPMLRVFYLGFGLAWPTSTQEVTNLAGAAVLAVWAPMAAVLASRTIPATRKREHLARLPGPWLDAVAGLAAAVGLAALVVAYVVHFDGVDRVTMTSVVAVGLGVALTQVNRRSADDTVAAEEWRIHATAMLATFPVTAVLWLVYAGVFTVEASFYGALLTGPAVPLSLGLLLVAWRRRRPVRTAEQVAVAA